MNPSVMQLQREAAARVRQMEERSRRLVHEHPIKIYRGTTVVPHSVLPPTCEEAEKATMCEPPCDEVACEPAPCEAPALPKPRPCTGHKVHGNSLVSWLAGDEERALLLLLAVVLWNNGAPLELLLALLYVAL